MSKSFLDAVKARRTFYGLSKEIVVSADKVKEIVGEAVNHTPSAFNSQSSRVVVLFGEQSDKLWSITKEALRKIVPAENFAATEERINGFANGYGTILFFEDQTVVKGLQEKFTSYADNFPIWSNQSSGMLQHVIWTALVEQGLGASLQHYNELIEAEVAQTWQLSGDWKLIAQMPFGKPTFAPGEKEFMPLSDRVKFF
ncbi:nitroreductase family protein [Paenibacillus sacheonensis]|uniref:Nitroreductase n=1 Tax=Paenibacillus sacheonensis TaxID=742054 RepID=A0A7X4YST6_9BACL|nr:nitroreductase family protein [Paenibacillus sacheonensis]MBM7569488.1 putative oxidoreductase (fatty acid repression mutant protein) [Paenibacillus sacheonensis]NBC71922.1 nitroreductase [Paenibacillus sacheonensis]